MSGAISPLTLCFRAWTGKKLAAIKSTFAHGTGQISNVSNASYCIHRSHYLRGALHGIPADDPGNISKYLTRLSILSLHRHLNMFFASCECSKYPALEMTIFICFAYTGIRTLMTAPV